MRNAVLTVILLALITGCTRAGQGPLSFQTPVHWKAEYQPSVDLYSVTATNHKAEFCLLMFCRWPVPNRPEDAPSLVRTLANRFLKKAQHSTQLELASRKYRIQKFSGGECSGSYAIFRIKADHGIIFQTVFAMSVNGSIWNGQFTGTSNNWVQALTVLKSVRKNG